MYLQPHWALCAFTGPVRDTPTIPLVSLYVRRPRYTYTPMGIPMPSQGFPNPRSHRKPLLKPYSFQFQRLSSNLSVLFTSSFSVFCLRQILSPTLMGPFPSLIHYVSQRLGLVNSASQTSLLVALALFPCCTSCFWHALGRDLCGRPCL